MARVKSSGSKSAALCGLTDTLEAISTRSLWSQEPILCLVGVGMTLGTQDFSELCTVPEAPAGDEWKPSSTLALWPGTEAWLPSVQGGKVLAGSWAVTVFPPGMRKGERS